MEKVTLFILVFGALFLSSKADRTQFSARISDEFIYIGKSVKVTVITKISEPGPLRYKFKVPFNVSAFMRIFDYKMTVNESLISITGSKTPNMTSSANNDNVFDIVDVNLGSVTPVGTVDIEMSFYAQLLNHPQLCSCEDLWINVGAEFTNSSIWAHQHAVKKFTAIDMQPALNVTMFMPSLIHYDTLTDGVTVGVNVRITHNPHETTAEVNNMDLVLLHPDFVVRGSMAKQNSNSIDLSVKSVSSTAMLLSTGILNYTDIVDYNLNFTLDPKKSKAKGKIHKANFALLLSYNYSSPLYGAPRTGNLKRPAISALKFYARRDSCETALGMASGTITNAMIRASSHSQLGLPHNARLNGASAWVPASFGRAHESQFIEVNFQGIKEVTRIDLQGNGKSNSYVRLFRVFYSLDCSVWTMYRTHEGKELLKGNTGPNKVAVIPLDPKITAKCIRINPRGWKKEIGLRFELYGCASSLSLPPSNLTSRTYLVDVTTDYVYACYIAMKRLPPKSHPSCFYSKDITTTRLEFIDPQVLNINFINPATRKIYGMGLRNSHYLCPATPEKGECGLISKLEYDKAKAVSVQAKVYDNITITEDPASKAPAEPDTFAMKNSPQKIGMSPVGMHYNNGASWNTQVHMSFNDDFYE